MEHTVICLSRQSGSGGREVGRRLAKRLNIPFYDYELIELAAEKEFDTTLVNTSVQDVCEELLALVVAPKV